MRGMLVLILLSLSLCAFSAQADQDAREDAVVRTQVHQCVGADGVRMFQDKLCANGVRDLGLRVLVQAVDAVPATVRGRSQSRPQTRPARAGRTERARSGQGSSTRRRRAESGSAARAPTARLETLQPLCPRTRQNAGAYQIKGQRVRVLATGAKWRAKRATVSAWWDYSRLPSETYLRNAGQLPGECAQARSRLR